MTSIADVSSAREQARAEAYANAPELRWKALHTVGGVAALLSVAIVIVAIVAHIAWPPPDWSPGTAVQWFARFEGNWLLGLLGLDLLIVFGLVLGIPAYLALYAALHRGSETIMAIAVAMALIGTVLHLVSNTAFEMLSFSQAYAAATTEAERAMFLAAGEATLAAYYGTSFHVSYILGYAARLLIGVVMLRSAIFSKGAAYVGIVTSIVGLGFYLPTVGLFFSVVSVVLIAVWNALIGHRLIQLGKYVAKAAG